jgi:hypothetical protein
LQTFFLTLDELQDHRSARAYYHRYYIGTISMNSEPGLVTAAVGFNPDFSTPLVTVTT